MILEYLSKNPIIGLLISIAGIIVAIVIAFLQKSRKQLGYRYNTIVIAKDNQFNETGLNIQYKEPEKEMQIEQLSKTSIEIRNIGNVRIEERYDVYDDAKMKIVPETKGFDIICARVYSESDDIIKCKVANTNNNEIEIHFNAIEENKCVVINVYHTGDQNDKFIVSGRIKDGEIVRLKAKNDNCNILIKTLAVLCMLNVVFYCGLLREVDLVYIVNKKDWNSIIMVMACFILCCFNIVMTVISYMNTKSFSTRE